MSGHSKWATIHRKKEANDAKRGASFTKIANAITVAVKEGGGTTDPSMNFKLRLMIDKARAANMPKENIQRAIERAAGVGADQLQEAVYEGFLPGGVGVLVATLSDNKSRSSLVVRDVFSRTGATIASLGSVSHGFVQKGEFRVQAHDQRSKDEIELDFIDLDVDDYENDDDLWILWVNKEKIMSLKEELEKKGYVIESVDLIMKPLNLVEVTDTDTQNKIEDILSRLMDLDEVQKVWTNYA